MSSRSLLSRAILTAQADKRSINHCLNDVHNQLRHSCLPRGVSYNRMSIIGFAFSQPKASNATEAGRSINRRVEIKIRGQAG